MKKYTKLILVVLVLLMIFSAVYTVWAFRTAEAKQDAIDSNFLSAVGGLGGCFGQKWEGIDEEGYEDNYIRFASFQNTIAELYPHTSYYPDPDTGLVVDALVRLEPTKDFSSTLYSQVSYHLVRDFGDSELMKETLEMLKEYMGE